MSCPYCNATSYIPEVAKENVRQYNSTPCVATLCCKQPIRLVGRISFLTTPIHTYSETDDWGVKFKKSLVGKYVLIEDKNNLDNYSLHKVIKDDTIKHFVKVEDSSHFPYVSIIYVGTKEEMKNILEKQLSLSSIIENQKETFKKFEQFIKDVASLKFHNH